MHVSVIVPIRADRYTSLTSPYFEKIDPILR